MERDNFGDQEVD